MSFVLRKFGIASCNVGSTVLVGVVGIFGWMDGVVTGAGVGSWVGSDDCYCSASGRSARISLNSFSISVL